MRLVIAAAALIAAFATAPAALAQASLTTVPLDSGRLVRIRLDDGSIVRGRLLRPFASDSAQLTYCRYPAAPCRRPDAPAASAVAAGRIAALEVQRGSRLWRGVAIGAGIGALLGGFAGWLDNQFCEYAGCGSPIPAWILSGAVSGGMWGALFGSQSVVWGPAALPGPE
jgi:hypothetical protein